MLGFSLLGRVTLGYTCRRKITWKQSKGGRCIGQEPCLACIHKPEKILAPKSYSRTIGPKSTKNLTSFYEEIVWHRICEIIGLQYFLVPFFLANIFDLDFCNDMRNCCWKFAPQTFCKLLSHKVYPCPSLPKHRNIQNTYWIYAHSICEASWLP